MIHRVPLGETCHGFALRNREVATRHSAGRTVAVVVPSNLEGLEAAAELGTDHLPIEAGEEVVAVWVPRAHRFALTTSCSTRQLPLYCPPAFRFLHHPYLHLSPFQRPRPLISRF
jgi:hypothetical protein